MPPFSPFALPADLFSSLSEAVGRRICPPGVQTHFSSRQNLFLLWGPMRALVCRSPSPCWRRAPSSAPICHQKHSSKFRSILSPPPPSSFFLPTLLLLLPCKHSDSLPAWSAASSVAPLQAVQSEYTERNFPPSHGCGILPSDATLHPPLHCTA